MSGGIEIAKVDWEAGAPRSIFFSDIYFSGDGAAESRHVFIDGNDLPARFAQAPDFSIGELGFGTGLNVLAAWDCWRRAGAKPAAQLHFLSFEKNPLSADDLARAHRAWPQFGGLSARLLRVYPPPAAGVHRLRLDDDATLTLVLGDAGLYLPRLEARIDAWFLDGFAPAKNPEMWTPAVFAEIARLSAPGATAATFTVAGDVRRALRAAGFAVEKRAGYGRKREMLAARLDAPPTPSRRAPWFQTGPARKIGAGADVAIIGGGVAGASLAFELAGAGAKPVIIDPGGLAGGASGNPAGLIMPRLDLDDGAPGRFFRAAYFHALRVIEALELGDGKLFDRCGALQMATSEDERARQEKIVAGGLLPPGWIETRDDGLYFPQAGVIDPRLYCARLAANTPVIARRALSFGQCAEGVAIDLSGGVREIFDAAIIANGLEAIRFVEARTLPLSGVMGQVDWFPDAPAPPEATVFGPYAAKAPAGGLVIGATFEPIEPGAAPKSRVAATCENIRAIAHRRPDIARELQADDAHPRASVRCQAPDRLPLAGAMPDWNHYGTAYDDLRLGRQRDYPPALRREGLYLLAGLGARGLVTAPLLAAFIVAELTAAPSPLEREIAEALHPARFFIRDLKRSQRIVSN